MHSKVLFIAVVSTCCTLGKMQLWVWIKWAVRVVLQLCWLLFRLCVLDDKPVRILCVAEVLRAVSRSLLSNANHVCVIHSLQMMLISNSFTCANKTTSNNSSSLALKAVFAFRCIVSIKTSVLLQKITESILNSFFRKLCSWGSHTSF